MTREDFEKLSTASSAALPIELADGRVGLCSHWNETHVIVDAYRGNDSEQVHIPYEEITHLSGQSIYGALKQA